MGYSLTGKLPSSMAEYLGAFAVITLVGHLAVRRLAPWADPLLLPLAALLNGLGIVMTYRLAAQGKPALRPAEPVRDRYPDPVHGHRRRRASSRSWP